MAVRDDRGDVKQTTTGFRGPLMVQSLTSAKSKFLSLDIDTRKFSLYLSDLHFVKKSKKGNTNVFSHKNESTQRSLF